MLQMPVQCRKPSHHHDEGMGWTQFSSNCFFAGRTTASNCLPRQLTAGMQTPNTGDASMNLRCSYAMLHLHHIAASICYSLRDLVKLAGGTPLKLMHFIRFSLELKMQSTSSVTRRSTARVQLPHVWASHWRFHIAAPHRGHLLQDTHGGERTRQGHSREH